MSNYCDYNYAYVHRKIPKKFQKCKKHKRELCQECRIERANKKKDIPDDDEKELLWEKGLL